MKKKKRGSGESLNVNASSRASKSVRSSVKGRPKKGDESTVSDDSVGSAVSGGVENVDSDEEPAQSEVREQRRLENEAHSSSAAASARLIQRMASLAPENDNVIQIQSFLNKNNMSVSQLQEMVDRGRLWKTAGALPVLRSFNARCVAGHSSSLR